MYNENFSEIAFQYNIIDKINSSATRMKRNKKSLLFSTCNMYYEYMRILRIRYYNAVSLFIFFFFVCVCRVFYFYLCSVHFRDVSFLYSCHFYCVVTANNLHNNQNDLDHLQNISKCQWKTSKRPRKRKKKTQKLYAELARNHAAI